jgi:hypothetical protein
MKSDPIMITPGRAGYFSVKRSGRHGSLREAKAVGRSCVCQFLCIKKDDNHGTYMDEGSGDEDTSTKMFAEEENLRGDLHPSDLFRYDWKSTTTD